MQKKKKSVREDSKIEKGQVALFWNKHIISGECTWVGKKYQDGQIIIEITLVKHI